MKFSDYRTAVGEALSTVNEHAIETMITWLSEARDKASTVFVCGNGGSAATASHFATDLGKGASLGFPTRFRTIALTDNVPLISAYANDVGYHCIFSEQVRSLASADDILVVISGSGNSGNIIAALEAAKAIPCRTIALTGFDGGLASELADLNLVVRSEHMGVIEDVHMSVCHSIAFEFIEAWQHGRS